MGVFVLVEESENTRALYNKEHASIEDNEDVANRQRWS